MGSKYYAENPIYPLRKTVANINMDVLNVNERTRDIYIGGAGQNDLEDDVAEMAPLLGRYIRKGGYDTGGGFFRSDHFNFVKAGVPALVAGSGSDVVKKQNEVMAEWASTVAVPIINLQTNTILSGLLKALPKT
ncbi:MAG: M28 family peptidase [Sphingobacteriales bacterium]|nr:M28 family peptidase [Sphingobacteriales bacterium]